MKISGAAAGAGLAAGATGTAAAAELTAADFEAFTNYRRRRASHAWERGYRGRADRVLAITDSGGESRHAGLGRWNGLVVTTDVEEFYAGADAVIPAEKQAFDFVDDAGRGIRDNTGDGNVTVDGDSFEIDLPAPDDDPQYVGWLNDSDRYGRHDAPRDTNSHGTHCTGIMTDSGRATTIDVDRSTVDEPRAVLAPAETLSYEVTAAADTAVFGSVYGEDAEVAIESPDGRILDSSASAVGPELSKLNNTVEHETVHGDGEATYTVYVWAPEGEALPVRVERVAAGAFKPPEAAGGDVADNGEVALHTGTAPGFSIFPVTDLSTGTEHLTEFVTEYNDRFNVRAVNMSWGLIGGYPGGTVAGADPVFGYGETVAEIRRMADSGILTVAAAGNSGQPASGNGPPAVISEAVSVVATGPLDGIASYSSGGVGGVDDETGAPYTKPDVTAPGGILEDLDWSTMPGDLSEDDPADEGDNFGDVFEYSGKGGTSMASPSVCGIAGLVAQAMEEDGPEEIALPAPGDTDRVDVLRLKQALLATASTTAFTAAPYHRAKAPAYTPGERDPYEGWGRVNAGAAVDAVSRDLEADGFRETAVGLDVPDDEGAVAGYVRADDGDTAREGELSVDVEFSRYSGGNAGLAKGDPHVDVLVVDAVEPVGVDADPETGEEDTGAPPVGDPNVVASARGPDGSASVSAGMNAGDVYYVVVELVDVPGAVNGNDLQVTLDISVDAALQPVPDEVEIREAARETSASVFTAGQTISPELTVETDRPVVVRDFVPEGWTVDAEYGAVEATESTDGGTFVYFALDGTDSFEGQYFAEAPERTGRYSFGPIEVTQEVDGAALADREYKAAGGTTDTVTVVGADTET